MPSRADASRVWIERALRTAAIGGIALAVWLSARAHGPSGAVITVAFDASPSAVVRDSLAAQRKAGTDVRWSARTNQPLAASAERRASPDGAATLAVIAPLDAVLHDGAAADTLRNTATGARFEMAAPSSDFEISSGGMRAYVTVPAAAPPRGVLVLGHASWESKFTVAALEEDGWHVDARITVAPGADVRQGTMASLDTSRYAAVVLLDSTVSLDGAALERFVRSGGGVVMAADAAPARSVTTLAVGAVGALQRASITFDAANPLASLAFRPLTVARADASILERRGTMTAVAARRVGLGRVLQIGYTDLWRWRLQGGDDALVAHRAWWTRAVSAVSSPPAPRPFTARSPEGAPLARLASALGAPTVGGAIRSSSHTLPPWLMPLLLLILLGEWGSRRLRGAR
ncbi:MAG: hypothetical protein NTZ43_01575 [Gemmatimonadetes bacterium]|nr:hypothetical protein [Gemmatimonadota bacterium]